MIVLEEGASSVDPVCGSGTGEDIEGLQRGLGISYDKV
jgi:23S rRNA G2445 N2-methylase RlmL